jgi:hypothetical protein
MRHIEASTPTVAVRICAGSNATCKRSKRSCLEFVSSEESGRRSNRRGRRGDRLTAERDDRSGGEYHDGNGGESLHVRFSTHHSRCCGADWTNRRCKRFLQGGRGPLRCPDRATSPHQSIGRDKLPIQAPYHTIVGDRGTGPSGSGKTTFLTLIGALRELQTGSISLLGQELRGAKPEVLVEARRGIGFIFQQHNLLPAFTAGENVHLTLAVHPGLSPRDCRMRAIELLSAVGMSEHLSSGRLSFREVSAAGGDCQGAGAAPARDFGR